MAFTLEHVQQVRNGQPRQVGVLPDSVWKTVGWPCPWVYLGQTGLQHIAKAHPDISDFDLLWIPLALASGMIVHVKREPNRLIVGYRATEVKSYRCALKTAQSGTEIWVSSYYRAKERQLRRLTRQGHLLRDHL